SRHPYARAVVRAAEAAGLKIGHDAGVRELAGFGLESSGPSGSERLGSAEWCGAKASASNSSAVWYRGGDGAVVRFDLQDRLRRDAADVLARLKAAGFHAELVSGDRGPEVEAVARLVGISRWMAGVLPAQKIARIAALKAAGRKVLMVGDGLNDAPALAAAHASLSPSTAADISQTAADAVFQGERLAPVLEVLAVARAARPGGPRGPPRRPPLGPAELRHRHRLQRLFRADGHGGSRHAALGRDCHVGLLCCGHRQRGAAEENAPGARMMTALAWLIPCA